MANHATTYTSRIRIHYSDSLALPHKMIMRLGNDSDPTHATSKWNAIASSFLACLFTTSSVDDVQFAPVGSSVFTPLAGLTLGVGTGSTAFAPTSMNAAFYVDLSLHSTNVPNAGGYLFNTPPFYNRSNQVPSGSIPAYIDDLITNILAQGFTSIDRDGLLDRSYVIVGQNDEVNHKLRR